jgi:cadmium resistance protein CadD (predicted permease)
MTFSNYSITLALLSFFSTTVDDFCVILIFFAREYVKTHSLSNPDTVLAFVKISIGQLIGFSIIVGVSLILGIGLHAVVDNDYIDLIGLLPIIIGLYKVYELLDEEGYLKRLRSFCCCMPHSEVEDVTEAKDVKHESTAQGEKRPLIVHDSAAGAGGSTTATKDDGMKQGARTDVDVDHVEGGAEGDNMGTILNEESLETLNELDQSNSFVVGAKSMFSCVDPLTFEVAIYALMFGTDNIAIYVALFSNVTFLEILAVVVFFYSLLLLYLFIAIFVIIQAPPVGKFIGDNANYLVPFVLIGLGVFILHDSVIWPVGHSGGGSGSE